jgi:formylglycine-generating enzyme required for sulfatase activity
MSRFSRALGLGFLGAIAYFTASDDSLAASCDPGKLNASGTCDCPAGYKSQGEPGSATCRPVYVAPKCGGAGQPACPGPPADKLPGDNGAIIPIKGGSFMMGDSISSNASPVRQVTVSDFALDKYEVSTADYKKCVDAGICAAPPSSFTSTQPRCNWGTKRSAHPMNCVSWTEANNYCLWKGKRLPTEAEWEYGARGKDSNLYPWGTAQPTCKQANFTEKSGAAAADCGDGTSVIGAHPGGKSPFGAQDMAGNVEEWTGDWWAIWKGGNAVNPGGPLTGTLRVVKGSAFDLSSASDQIAARREGINPNFREPWLGFRCVQGPSVNATPAYYVPPAPPPPPPGETPGGGSGGFTPAPSDLGNMIKIPGGSFSMGSALEVDSSPAHQVTLSPYSIDKYEVTVSEYKKCVATGKCLTPINSLSPHCNYDKSGKDYHPVNCIEWSDAKAYCSSVGKRLPTEAEWEFASRGSDGRTWPWGYANPSCSHASFKLDSGGYCASPLGTEQVGRHPLGISYWGVHDLSGNIEEWVYDLWGKYQSGPTVNPSGPMSGGNEHVVRGGNWEIESKYMRTFARFHFKDAKYWVGFRCAKTGS